MLIMFLNTIYDERKTNMGLIACFKFAPRTWFVISVRSGRIEVAIPPKRCLQRWMKITKSVTKKRIITYLMKLKFFDPLSCFVDWFFYKELVAFVSTIYNPSSPSFSNTKQTHCMLGLMRIISRTVAIFGASISLLFLRDCIRQREYDKLTGGICRTRSE